MPDSHPCYKQQAYLWMSIALAAPVFIWPCFLVLDFTPAFGVSIEQNWLISACCLLLASIVSDSILGYKNRLRDALNLALSVMIATSVISFAIRNPDSSWLIACLFGLRSLQAAYTLAFQKTTNDLPWWVWMAWWRDSSTAITMLLWIAFWPQ